MIIEGSQPGSALSVVANESPIFVLTCARSGSTLLRFILDSHPELACPPELGLGAICMGLVRLYYGLSNDTGHDGRQRSIRPAVAPGHATDNNHEEAADISAAGGPIREVVQNFYRDYLASRNKIRWCDKSLDNAFYASQLAQLFPDARFICLYRHGMDVIASGIEACPWGLQGYGFENYAVQFPGNSVAAIAAYWLHCTNQVLEFEDSHRDACLRVRYEDLVSDPEQGAAAIFDFLGLTRVPGISRSCFSVAHDWDGPSDQKIWFTNQVSADSLGRGTRVPVDALPPALLADINETLARLEFRQVDAQWKRATGRVDPRLTVPVAARQERTRNGTLAELTAVIETIAERMLAAPTSLVDEISTRWPMLVGRRIRIVVETEDHGSEEFTWHLVGGADPPGTAGNGRRAERPTAAEGSAAREDAPSQDAPSQDAPSSAVVGSASTWRSLLSGEANMAVAIQTRLIRCIEASMPDRICPPESVAVALMLGIAQTPSASAVSHGGPPTQESSGQHMKRAKGVLRRAANLVQ